MLKYKRWIEVVELKSLVAGKVVLRLNEIFCDGWYLFGKYALVTRQNIK